MSSRFIIRPVESRDLSALVELAKKTGVGLTTLPADEDFLNGKILDSSRAFHPAVRKPAGEAYLFVLEDLTTKKIVGTSGIVSKVGGFEPFYTYRIEQETHESASLNVKKQIPVLHLATNHNGPTEVCGLFLDPEARQHGLGRLLSLCRFLFMAEFPKRFEKTVISELRGWIDDSGKSPFWECVGRHFFQMDFYTADFFSGIGKKDFIADLMPEYPIYIPLLPHAVQECVGKVHRDTQPARKLLERQGFVYQNEVDIFDAGPTVAATTAKIDAIASCQKLILKTTSSQLENGDLALVSNSRLDFRCLQTPVVLQNGKSVLVTESDANALGVVSGDVVQVYVLAAAGDRGQS